MDIKLIISIVFLMIACGKEKNTSSSDAELEDKKKLLAAAHEERQKIEHKIALLEKGIEQMDPTAIRRNIPLVAIVVAEKTPFEHKIEVRGSAKSRKNILMSAQTAGLAEHIYVEEGQHVKKGQLLISLDADVLRNTIAEYKTSLELSSSIYRKREQLWSKNIGTEIQYLEAKNNKEALERKLITANSQLEQMSIKAPFAGAIEKIGIKEGELASPGTPLLKITSPHTMHLQADISEKYIEQFNVGDKVNVHFPKKDQVYNSRIKAIGQVINEQNRTFEIEVNMPNTSFKVMPNQVVTLHIRNYYNPQAWVVPTRIVQRDNLGHFIFCIKTEQEKTKAVKVRIEIGRSYNSNTEVIKGIDEKDQIVYQGFHELTDDNEVNVVTDKKQIAE